MSRLVFAGCWLMLAAPAYAQGLRGESAAISTEQGREVLEIFDSLVGSWSGDAYPRGAAEGLEISLRMERADTPGSFVLYTTTRAPGAAEGVTNINVVTVSPDGRLVRETKAAGGRAEHEDKLVVDYELTSPTDWEARFVNILHGAHGPVGRFVIFHRDGDVYEVTMLDNLTGDLTNESEVLSRGVLHRAP